MVDGFTKCSAMPPTRTDMRDSNTRMLRFSSITNGPMTATPAPPSPAPWIIIRLAYVELCAATNV